MKRILSLLLCLLFTLAAAPGARAESVGVPEERPEPPVKIATLEELHAFAEGCALESYSKGRVFLLEADLSLDAGFAPIPYFAGVFLGNGHTVSGLELRGDGSRMGFFRQLAPGSSVSGLTVEGSVCPGGTRIQIGGLAGTNAGTVENCSFRGTAAGLEDVGGLVGTNEAGGVLRGCSFEGELRGEHRVGGMAGTNLGLIEDCRSLGRINTAAITPEREWSFDLSAVTEDDFLDLADIGGLAGDNGGVIRACRSEGEVGRANTGYNVGGVAGKSSGFITGCVNLGPVRGRRDAGGIVGQLIPHAIWDFSEDRLGGLTDELERLDALLERGSQGAEQRTAELREGLNGLHASVSDALDELAGVLSYYTGAELIGFDPDTGLPLIPEFDPAGPDLDGLNRALDRVYAESAALSLTLGEDAAALGEYLRSLSAQLSRTLGVMDGMLGADRDGALFESFDLSADETYEHEAGAVDGCFNGGSVEAESSAGGIAGSMAFEISFDREDRLNASDFLASDAKRYLFAALRRCESRGEISVRGDGAGGVVGRAELGAVADCVGAAAVSSQKGDDVGGIAGSSAGCIRGCWARGVLGGGKYIGGVAGRGHAILGCASWVSIERGAEYLGAVAGLADGEVSGNRYAGDAPAGVDGVSLEGQCEPVSVAALLALEGAPEGFDELELRFYVGDRLVETRVVPFGSEAGEPPAVPDEGARRWRWEDFDGGRVYRSMELHGGYTEPVTVLASAEEPPLYLVEGVFAEEQRLRVLPVETLPEEEPIAAARLLVEGYEGALTVHLRAPGGAKLFLIAPDGTRRPLSYETDKSYLVFSLDNGGSFVCLPGTRAAAKLPWAAAGGGALLIAAALPLLLKRRKKAAAAAAGASPEGDGGAEEKEKA